MDEEKYVANVFIVNEPQLDKAIKLALSEIAKVSPVFALEWAKEYIHLTEESKDGD